MTDSTLAAAPRKYWYRIFVGECPVCGRNKGHRQRIYCDVEARPLLDADRYHPLSDEYCYDGCDA